MNSEKLLLVGGFPSGGTDLMKNILNANPNIFISGEVPFLSQIGLKAKFDNKDDHTSDEILGLKDAIVSLDVYGNVANRRSGRQLLALRRVGLRYKTRKIGVRNVHR